MAAKRLISKLLCGATFGLAASLFSALAGTTNLLPGVTFHDGPEELPGNLVFLIGRETGRLGQGTNPAAIYQFNVQKRELRKVCDAPGGWFVPSRDGRSLFSVYYSTNYAAASPVHNVFLYSDEPKLSRTLTLPAAPSPTLLTGGHAYFGIHSYEADRSVDYVIDYDPVIDAKRVVSTQESPLNGPEALGVNFRSADGRFVFFQGRDAPIHGTRLVSSPRTVFETRNDDAERKDVSVLKEFPPVKGGQYTLWQMSPCRRYALVRLSTPSRSLFASSRGGYQNNYFLVVLSTGKTRTLLEDQTVEKAKGSMSEVWWVP